jgi:hypothetical protein
LTQTRGPRQGMLMRRFVHPFWLLFVLACAEDGARPVADVGARDSPDAGTDGGAGAQVEVGRQGGVLRLGAARLEVPSGALELATTLRVHVLPPESFAFGADYRPASEVFGFEPAGTTFAVPARLTIAAGAASPDAVIFASDESGQGLEPLETTCDAQGSCSALLNHFSIAALFSNVSETIASGIINWCMATGRGLENERCCVGHCFGGSARGALACSNSGFCTPVRCVRDSDCGAPGEIRGLCEPSNGECDIGGTRTVTIETPTCVNYECEERESSELEPCVLNPDLRPAYCCADFNRKQCGATCCDKPPSDRPFCSPLGDEILSYDLTATPSCVGASLSECWWPTVATQKCSSVQGPNPRCAMGPGGATCTSGCADNQEMCGSSCVDKGRCCRGASGDQVFDPTTHSCSQCDGIIGVVPAGATCCPGLDPYLQTGAGISPSLPIFVIWDGTKGVGQGGFCSVTDRCAPCGAMVQCVSNAMPYKCLSCGWTVNGEGTGDLVAAPEVVCCNKIQGLCGEGGSVCGVTSCELPK